MRGSHKFQLKRERGYILLLTVLLTSIILGISFGVYAIGLKSLMLSSFLKDSQRALAAADRGAECALYWDYSYRNNSIGGTVFPNNSLFSMPGTFANATCAGISFVNNGAANWSSSVTPTTGNTTFSLKFNDNTCTDVRVYKSNTGRTEITSSGVSDCNDKNLRRTQRTIQVYSESGTSATGDGKNCPFTPQPGHIIINFQTDPTAVDGELRPEGRFVRTDLSLTEAHIYVKQEILPGTYRVRMHTYDEGATRMTETEPFERVMLSFRDVNQNIIVDSLRETAELGNGSPSISWTGVIDENLVIPSTIDWIKAYSFSWDYNDKNPATPVPVDGKNDLMPICADLEDITPSGGGVSSACPFIPQPGRIIYNFTANNFFGGYVDSRYPGNGAAIRSDHTHLNTDPPPAGGHPEWGDQGQVNQGYEASRFMTPWPVSSTAANIVPDGTYRVSAFVYDGYAGREFEPEEDERVRFHLLDMRPNCPYYVAGVTDCYELLVIGDSPDLSGGSSAQSWQGVLNPALVIDNPYANGYPNIKPYSIAYDDKKNLTGGSGLTPGIPNLVQPVCIAFDPVAAINTPPVITVNPTVVTLEVGSPPVTLLSGVTGTDVEDGTVTVTSSGSVNTAVVGTYTITYNANDSGGLPATAKTRTYVVLSSADASTGVCPYGKFATPPGGYVLLFNNPSPLSPELARALQPYEMISTTGDIENGYYYDVTPPTTISAGRYDIEIYSYDGYAGRAASMAVNPQLNESYRIQFYDNSTYITQTVNTIDVGNAEYSFSNTLSANVNISSPSNSVRVRHAAHYPTNCTISGSPSVWATWSSSSCWTDFVNGYVNVGAPGQWDSVRPVCALLKPVP